jgi:D-aminoacyl-tRNA deacylase
METDPHLSVQEHHDQANALYEYFLSQCRKEIPVVEQGIFGAHMMVSLINDGPFTIVLDSDEIIK